MSKKTSIKSEHKAHHITEHIASHPVEHIAEHDVGHRTEHACCETFPDPIRVGLSFGIVASSCMILLSFMAASLGWGRPLVSILGSFLLGYGATFVGAIYGGIWGFSLGFVKGYMVSKIYCLFSGCKCCPGK
ncbi:MAG: hypothetical protein HGA85_00860 [Nanoarchaeota archaeon]|nr:hypothetical protein [Nanoarchaeota archaeon]